MAGELDLSHYLGTSDAFREQVQLIYDQDKENKRYCFTGDRDFLFPLYDLEFLISPNAKTIPIVQESIYAFRDFLAANEVELLVVLIPNKGQLLYPFLTPVQPPEEGPAPWSRGFASELEADGISTVHLFEPLREGLSSGIRPEEIFLLEDVHWGPKAIEIAGGVIAKKIEEMGTPLGEAERERFTLEAATANTVGVCIEWLPPEHPRYGRSLQTKVLVNRVFDKANAPFRADPESKILLAGDSFSEMFLESNAGLDAHLSSSLGYRVDRLSQQGGGPALPRIMLRDQDRYLDGKKLVVWVFVDRYLNARNWRPIK